LTEEPQPLLLERALPQQGANELVLAAPLPEFRVGRALARSFAILRRNPLAFLLPIAAIQLVRVSLDWFRQDWFAARAGDALSLHSILVLLLSTVVVTANQAIIADAVLQALRGQRVRVGGSSRLGLIRSMAVIGTGLCSTVLVFVGSFLLLIPGLWAQTAFLVAAPVCVVETRGPLASLKRSAELTRGYRWRVFGLWLLLIFVTSLVGGGMRFAAAAHPNMGTAMSIAEFVWHVIAGACNAIIYVVTYHNLRVAKEGIDLDRIAEVFD